MPEIKCMVEECKYNDGRHCSASQVDVCSCGCSHVTCANETACETFVSRK